MLLDEPIRGVKRNSPLQYDEESEQSLLLAYATGERYYDPVVARFISEDPIRQAGGDNLQRYVGNNPINRIDPSGHDDTWGGAKPDNADWLDGKVNVSEANGHHWMVWVEKDGNGQVTKAGWTDLDKNAGLMGEAFSQAEHRQAQAVNQLQAVEAGAAEARAALDFVGSFNPLVNASTAVTGKSASGQHVSGSDQAMAAAGLVFLLGKPLKGIAQLLRLAEESKVVGIVERAQILERSTGGLEQMSADARRIYELAKDVEAGKPLPFEALAALRYERETGYTLLRPATKGGIDFVYASKTAGREGLDVAGAYGSKKWLSADATGVVDSVARKLVRKDRVDILLDLSDAPHDKAAAILKQVQSLANPNGKVIHILGAPR